MRYDFGVGAVDGERRPTNRRHRRHDVSLALTDSSPLSTGDPRRGALAYPDAVLTHSLLLDAGAPFGLGRQPVVQDWAECCAASSAVTRVDDAEAVAFRIRKDDEVWIGRVVPHHASGAEPDQPLDLISLFVGVVDDEIEM
jgi:hypothetical protein